MSNFVPRRGPRKPQPTHRPHTPVNPAGGQQPPVVIVPVVQQQPAPQQSAPAPQPKREFPVVPAVIALIVVGVLFGAYQLYNYSYATPENTYVARYAVDVELFRDLPAAAPAVPANEYFTDLSNLNKIAFEGQGIRVKLTWRENGHPVKNETFDFPPLARLSEMTPGSRQDMIPSQQAKLGEAIAWFQGAPDVKNRQEITAVDDTSGVDEKLANQVDFYFKARDVYNLAKGGDNVTLRFHRLASTNFVEGKVVSVPAKSLTGSKDADITLALGDWLTKPRGPQPESPLAAGIMTIAAEAKVDKNTHWNIHSDGIENTANLSMESGTKYYDDPDYLADPNHWKEVDDKIDEPIKLLRGTIPSLNGSTADWYTPPLEAPSRATKAERDRILQRVKVIRAVMAYWRHYWAAHGGGEIQMH